jgi:hypothetical protein
VNSQTKYAEPYLAARGVKLDTALAEGVEIMANSTHPRSVFRLRIGDESGLKGDFWAGNPLADLVEEGLWFPCKDYNGTIREWLLRPFPSLSGKDGSLVKFLSSRSGDNFPFIPRATWAAREKSSHPLFLTEGPCKALSILQSGGLPIAVSGAWMAAKTNAKRALELHPAIRENFVLRGRTVFLAFDADYASNPAIRQALIRTAILFHKAGAEVKVVTWPIASGKGIDDYLAAESDAPKALDELCEKAGQPSCVVRPCDLEIVEMELTRARIAGARLKQFCRTVARSLVVDAETLCNEIRDEQADAHYETERAITPWPEEVDGAALINEIISVIKRHIVMTDSQACAAALWILLTYLEAAVDCLPFLMVSSPVKRCGKTTFLAVLGRLVYLPLLSSNCSSAVIYRIIEKFHPTLLIDEVETWLKDNREASGIINSGHTRSLAYVWRCNPDSGEPEKFSTWCPRVLSGIGNLSDTNMDRSIVIRLVRRSKGEKIIKLRDVSPDEFDTLRQKLVRWSADHLEDIKQVRPHIPDQLDDRQGDNWFPLLAIANELGGDWPARVRKLALVLSDSDDTETVQTILLSAIREVFKEWENPPFLSTEVLVSNLNEDKSMPWSDWAHGKGLTEKKLGSILSPFGVKSERPRKPGEKRVHGYMLKDLQEVFDRFSPAPPQKNGSIRATDSQDTENE